MSHNMVDNSIVTMRHHCFRMLGFHLRFWRFFGKKQKVDNFWPTFVQLLGVPNFVLNAGIISVSGVFITQKNIAVKMGLFWQFSHKSNPESAKSWPISFCGVRKHPCAGRDSALAALSNQQIAFVRQ